MSEGQEGRDVAATVNGGESQDGAPTSPATTNEDKGQLAVPPTMTEGEDQAVTTPEVDEDQGLNPVSPVRSYEPGTDHLEQVISEGETKYEGKGKGRTESFSHLPTTGQSAPSTAPSTRPTSHVQDEPTPSTAPTTRPTSQVPDDSGPSTASNIKAVSQAQADPEPNMADGNSAVTEAKEDSAAITTSDNSGPSTSQSKSAAITTQDNSEPFTSQSNSAPASSQGDSAAIAAQDGTQQDTTPSGSGPINSHDRGLTRNTSVKYHCECKDFYDDTGKKRQQACKEHRIDSRKSWQSVPPVKPLSESTNLSIETRKLPVRAPRETHKEESPPDEPPVTTPTRGRNFVQESEGGPMVLDAANSDPAIEPTGPPNTLATIPTQKDMPLKVKKDSAGGVSKVMGLETHNKPTPPPVHQGAADQPQRSDAVEEQDHGSRLPVDEQRTAGKETTEEDPTEEKLTEEKPTEEKPTEEKLTEEKPTEEEPTEEEPTEEEPTEEKLTEEEPTEEEPTEEEPTEEKPIEGTGHDGKEVTLSSSTENLEFEPRGSTSPVPPLNSPHHRQASTPKSILKKTAGTRAERRQGMSSHGSDEDSEDKDPHGGAKLFRDTLKKLKAGDKIKFRNSPSSTGIEDKARIVDVSELRQELGTGMGAAGEEEDADADTEAEADSGRKVCPWKCTIL